MKGKMRILQLKMQRDNLEIIKLKLPFWRFGEKKRVAKMIHGTNILIDEEYDKLILKI
jgi:hypothetical protein